jgi:hypothetical protein
MAQQLRMNRQLSVLRKMYSGVFAAVGIEASTFADGHYLG